MIKFFEFKGFTLAEVLITLGIIGVVASLTLPAIIMKQKKENRVALLLHWAGEQKIWLFQIGRASCRERV